MANDASALDDGISRAYRAYVLAILVVVYTFNFLDRQIVGILAVPIKAELGLSDTQLGLMGGLAFALFYTSLGIPIAWLSDRWSRTWIMTLALALWSGMTAVCGLVQSFAQLFLARLGVGVGEAGGVAPAYSLICDYFPPQHRARALSVYSFGIPIGGATGIGLGGVIASLIDWRVAFFFVGLAGLALAPLFRLSVREPVRGGFDRPSSIGGPVSLATVLRVLGGKPSFWGLSFGAACASMIGYGLFFWLPSLFVRSFGLTLLQASLMYAAVLLFGGLAGIWLGGVLADRLGERHKAAYGLVPAVAFLASTPCYMAGVLAANAVVAFAILLLPTALSLVWLGPVLSAVQHVVPPGMRATASALFLFINNLIGLGAGTLLLGALSDAWQTQLGAESLRYAIVSGTLSYLLAAALMLLSARRLERDWHR